jgi:DNA excision repair protein ERCC-2
MLDTKINEIWNNESDMKNTIVVFDEAHNIDNICLEAYSVDINKSLIESS